MTQSNALIIQSRKSFSEFESKNRSTSKQSNTFAAKHSSTSTQSNFSATKNSRTFIIISKYRLYENQLDKRRNLNEIAFVIKTFKQSSNVFQMPLTLNLASEKFEDSEFEKSFLVQNDNFNNQFDDF